MHLLLPSFDQVNQFCVEMCPNNIQQVKAPVLGEANPKWLEPVKYSLKSHFNLYIHTQFHSWGASVIWDSSKFHSIHLLVSDRCWWWNDAEAVVTLVPAYIPLVWSNGWALSFESFPTMNAGDLQLSIFQVRIQLLTFVFLFTFQWEMSCSTKGVHIYSSNCIWNFRSKCKYVSKLSIWKPYTMKIECFKAPANCCIVLDGKIIFLCHMKANVNKVLASFVLWSAPISKLMKVVPTIFSTLSTSESCLVSLPILMLCFITTLLDLIET